MPLPFYFISYSEIARQSAHKNRGYGMRSENILRWLKPSSQQELSCKDAQNENACQYQRGAGDDRPRERFP